MTDNDHSLVEQIRNDDLWTGVDGADEMSILLVGEEKHLSLVKTTEDVGAESVVIFGGYELF